MNQQCFATIHERHIGVSRGPCEGGHLLGHPDGPGEFDLSPLYLPSKQIAASAWLHISRDLEREVLTSPLGGYIRPPTTCGLDYYVGRTRPPLLRI